MRPHWSVPPAYPRSDMTGNLGSCCNVRTAQRRGFTRRWPARNEKVVGSIPTGGSTPWMRIELQQRAQTRSANSERSRDQWLFRQARAQVTKHGDQFVRVVHACVPKDPGRQVTTRAVAEAITHTDRTGKRRTLADATKTANCLSALPTTIHRYAVAWTRSSDAVKAALPSSRMRAITSSASRAWTSSTPPAYDVFTLRDAATAPTRPARTPRERRN